MEWIDGGRLTAFLAAAVLVAASPGANNLLALSNGATLGLKVSLTGLLGRLAAFTLLIAGVAVGLATLLEASSALFEALRWIGVAYLIYLAVAFWRRPEDRLHAREGAPGRPSAAIRREFLTAITNPKAPLLFAVFVPQFVDPSKPFVPQLVLLSVLYLAIEGSAASIYALVGRGLGAAERAARRPLPLNKAAGVMMGGAAGVLALSPRTG